MLSRFDCSDQGRLIPTEQHREPFPPRQVLHQFLGSLLLITLLVCHQATAFGLLIGRPSALEAVVKPYRRSAEGLAKQCLWYHTPTHLMTSDVGGSTMSTDYRRSNRFDDEPIDITPIFTARASLAYRGTRHETCPRATSTGAQGDRVLQQDGLSVAHDSATNSASGVPFMPISSAGGEMASGRADGDVASVRATPAGPTGGTLRGEH